MADNLSIHRRTVLASCAGLAVSLAGCSSFSNQPADPEVDYPPPLQNIRFKNLFDNPQKITLVVEKDEELVHWDSHEIASATNTQDEDIRYRYIELENKDWMGCGVDQVSAALENSNKKAMIDFHTLPPSTSSNSKFPPLELTIEFSPERLRIGTTRLDKPRIQCTGYETTN